MLQKGRIHILKRNIWVAILGTDGRNRSGGRHGTVPVQLSQKRGSRAGVSDGKLVVSCKVGIGAERREAAGNRVLGNPQGRPGLGAIPPRGVVPGILSHFPCQQSTLLPFLAIPSLVSVSTEMKQTATRARDSLERTQTEILSEQIGVHTASHVGVAKGTNSHFEAEYLGRHFGNRR